jgi:hypothetical protein
MMDHGNDCSAEGQMAQVRKEAKKNPALEYEWWPVTGICFGSKSKIQREQLILIPHEADFPSFIVLGEARPLVN